LALYTKSIFKEASLEDGLRISVMSRHTLNDGKTIDERITREKYDVHLPQLAPHPKLVGAWHRKEISWNLFEQKYFKHIRTEDIASFVEALAAVASQTDITILCSEDTTEYCHRRLLAEECKKYQLRLIVFHK